MATLNEIKMTALAAITSQTGLTVDGQEAYFLESVPATGTRQGMTHSWLTGLAVASGTLNGRLMAYLGGLGYTGTLNERLHQWYTAGGPV